MIETETALQGGVPLRSRRGVFLLALPTLLFATSWGAFTGGTLLLGKDLGYLLGFAFYWLFWCTVVPLILLGRAGFAATLATRVRLLSRANVPAALLLLVVIGVAAAMYGAAFVRTPWPVMAVAAPLAIVNGFCEEVLWRGVYVVSFPRRPWLAVGFPALGFALWHFVPQSVFPAASGPVPFVASTLCLGLVYGVIAYRMRSAKWTAISHALNGILASGGRLAPVVLGLL